MVRACGTQKDRRDRQRFLVWEPAGNSPSGMPGDLWEEDIEMDYQEVGLSVDWVGLVQDMYTQGALVNGVKTRWVLYRENI